jgi:adenylosuccinate synthase
MTNIAIIGMQWGDEGKGKIVDFLSNSFDAVVRFQGGHNAGHTIKVEDKTYKLSLLPSGLVRGKKAVIGSGVVIDPVALFNEIENVSKQGLDVNENNLNIADNATLILSIHKQLDQNLESAKGKNKIGTTGRGIGPAYEDKVGRRAIRICDLENEEVLISRLENLLAYHNILRRGMGLEELKVNDIVLEINEIKDRLLKFSKPSFEIAKDLGKLDNIMFEGAQGARLDVGFGTYPFVTSSNTAAGQVAIGSCLGVGQLDKTIGILKAYTTRVGSGPFPTELANEIGEFLQVEGGEIGTVTGRDRRCGWFDAPLVRQAIQISGVKQVVLTKLDVLNKLEKIQICVAYDIDGEVYDHLPAAIDKQQKIKPIYEEFEGWNSNINDARSLDELPDRALKYIKKIEELLGVKIAILSLGPKRDETIIIEDFLS